MGKHNDKRLCDTTSAKPNIAIVQGRDEENAELYSNYKPARSDRIGGHPHPDPIVETASLAGVSPPEPSYAHHLQVCMC